MRQRRLKNEINVVPYIDVMLVLLVIFMVTAPMMQTGNIDVPSAGPLVAPPQEAAVIEVDKDGKLALKQTANSKAVPLSFVDFQRELKKLIDADQPVLVAAHNDLPYQKVIDVLEEARKQGVKKISLQTKSSSTGK
ncbi:MAG: ExbD/TolR family protein [Azoarcus sp.]|jgi:biopolymer transport protein TolR|nr:ExbD/TolR family protein [Azoarcus sp.]MDR1227863.1 ExbD/TolR family protein [Azoarcus sp.]